MQNKEELDDDEKKLAAKYKAFSATLKMVKKEIPFSDDDYAALKPSTKKFVAKHGIKVHEGMAFGASVTKVLSTRLIDLILL